MVDDDFELTPKTFRRYGSKIYVMGDVNISDDAAEVLEQVEYLHASGDVSLSAALEDVFYAIPDVEYEDLQLLTGMCTEQAPAEHQAGAAGAGPRRCYLRQLRGGHAGQDADAGRDRGEAAPELLRHRAVHRSTGSRSSGCGGQRGTDQSNGCCERRERPGHPLPDRCRIDPVRHLPLNDPPRS